jgi:uncharacterized protein (DUF885 family)
VDQTAARLNAAGALDTFLEHDLRRRPVQATFTGLHDHDHRLPNWSLDGLDAARAEMVADRRLLADAGLRPDDEVRTFPECVDLALADGHLHIQLAELESEHFVHHNPALWTGEALFAIIALVTRDFAPIPQRLEHAAARMRGLPAFLQQARSVLRTSPDPWRARALRECDAAERFFGESLPRWFPRTGVGTALIDDAERSAHAALVAFEEFRRWLSRELPASSPAHLCAGRTLLDLLLRRGHWCQTPIDTLLEEAHEALETAHATFEGCARNVAPGGWADVQEQLAAAHPSRDTYLRRFVEVWNAARDAALAHDLVTWPHAPIRYVPLPEHTRDIAPALYYLFYRSPAPFDRMSVHDYVVTPVSADLSDSEQRRRLRANNDSVIKLNHVVHHGGLGHHVQNHHAYAGASVIGRVAAVDGANRIGMFSGGTMAEGWACYACDLMQEIGFLSPLESVAEQHTRVRLLTRAVADLELHIGRRTLDQTAALYRERAAMPAEAAWSEAVKNSMFPGVAVMYWLGTRALHELRRTISRREGGRFTLRRFHDRVLSHGSIPVALVARLMLPDGHA